MADARNSIGSTGIPSTDRLHDQEGEGNPGWMASFCMSSHLAYFLQFSHCECVYLYNQSTFVNYRVYYNTLYVLMHAWSKRCMHSIAGYSHSVPWRTLASQQFNIIMFEAFCKLTKQEWKLKKKQEKGKRKHPK